MDLGHLQTEVVTEEWMRSLQGGRESRPCGGGLERGEKVDEEKGWCLYNE